MAASDEGPMLETLGYTIRIDSTPTFLYFDLYLHGNVVIKYVATIRLRKNKYAWAYMYLLRIKSRIENIGTIKYS